MPIGAGLAPAGTSPAGFGVPETAGAPAINPLPDPKTGLSLTGRYIDQKTGDYVMLADGRLQGMATVEQLVLLALNSVDFSDLLDKGPNFRATFANRVQNALADLITKKWVQIRAITISEPNPDAGLAVLDWVDLTTGAPKQTPIGTT